MSSIDQPVDAQLIEQTKRQIQSLVAEIAQLSKQSVTPGEFYGGFLSRIVSALAAIGGAVWTTNDHGQLVLQHQINLQQTNLSDDEESQRRHSRLLYKALSQGEGMIVPPHSGFGEEDEAANPTEFLLVIGPLRTDLEMVGLVEIFQRSDGAPNVQQGYLRFLMQMCELGADFLKSHQLRHFSDRQVLWARLEEFTRGVHASLEPIQTAYTIANEGRRLIECDRVSVAIRRGNRCTIEAVSGQDVFDKRSNLIRLLGRLATAVVATGDAVWYAGDTTDLAPQVEDAIQEYVDEAHSKMIAVLPLGRPKPDQEADAAEHESAEGPIGALVVEQIEDNRVAPALAQRIDVVCQHSSTALANAMEHQSLFLMPVWRLIGKSRVLVKARTLPKTLSVAVGVLLVLLALFLWPARFELNAKGTLEPVNRRDVFARVDGVVVQIGEPDHKIEHGTLVRAGDLLLKLRNTEVEVAKGDLEGQRFVALERVLSLQRLLSDRNLRQEQREQTNGDLAEAREKYRSLDAQLTEYKQKIADLEVRSPIDGQVMTWDLENRLLGRPVQRGQALIRVANPDGPWELELHMGEDHMGHIVRAQQDEELRYGYELPVTYVLATETGASRQGTIQEGGVAGSAEVRGDEGNTVLIKVDIQSAEIPEADLRPGAAVTAKVYCGRRSLGFVWFHDVLAFVQSRILFRL